MAYTKGLMRLHCFQRRICGVSTFVSEAKTQPLSSKCAQGHVGLSQKLRVRLSIQRLPIGGGHTLLALESGDILGVGRNDAGQLGLGEGSPLYLRSWTFLTVPLDSSNLKLAAGWDFSYVFNEKEVAVSGSNAFSQIALSQNIKKCKDWTKIDYPFKSEGIQDIACGLRHALFLTRQGNVYGVGSNRKGQLGVSSPEIFSLPSPVLCDRGVRQISAGQNFSLCLLEDGSVIGWGDDKFGQLQIPPLESPLVGVECGWTHGVGLCQSGQVIAWGRNSYGQTSGHGLGPCEAISSGSEHVIAIHKRDLFSWGWNEHGNCGDGSTNNVFSPSPVQFGGVDIKSRQIKLIRAGPGHSLAYITSL